MTDNYVSEEILAGSDVSSEQAAFPVTNAYNGLRRSKVWRSNGFWEIVSGDNTIVFNEGGSDLTATIAPGQYTSTSSFLAALDTAFTTAPGAAGSYTVTLSPALKFVITKSAGTFTIKWTHANSADMAAILGYDTATNDTGALAYTADVLKVHTSEWILWDMGWSSNPTAFFLIGPRNSPIKISPSAVIKLQGNETDVWTMPSYETTLSYDDEVIQKVSDTGLHTEALRYWRVLFEDQSNPFGYVEVGAFFLGTHSEFERAAPQYPVGEKEVDRTTEVTSEGGQSFSDIQAKTQSVDLKWKALTKADQQEFRRIFTIYGTGLPFFMVFDANVAFSTAIERRIKYVKFQNEPTYELVSFNNWDATTSFLEQL